MSAEPIEGREVGKLVDDALETWTASARQRAAGENLLTAAERVLALSVAGRLQVPRESLDRMRAIVFRLGAHLDELDGLGF